MINSIISALIAIFFWGKPDKKEKERIRRASLIRTIVYAMLSLFVFLFYVKSNQVATISNFIVISNGRADYNSKGEVLDTVYSLNIYNKFSGDATYQNDIVNYSNTKFREHGRLFSENGGITMDIVVHSKMLDSIKSGPYLEEDYFLKIKKQIPDINHLFNVSYIATSIPTIIPLYPKYYGKSNWKKDELFVHRNTFENTRHSNKLFLFPGDDEHAMKMRNNHEKQLAQILENGLVATHELGSRNLGNVNFEQDEMFLQSIFASFFVNNLNIFTAADISQYAYFISFTSELPIKTVNINYNVPIETQALNDSMKVGPNNIIINGEDLGFLQNNSLMLYVKLPTMANLQLIRSFILTTLLTILLSLFIRNFYNWIRKWAEIYKQRHRLPYTTAKYLNRNRINLFKFSVYLIILGFFIVSLYFSILFFTGHTILVSDYILEHGEYMFIGLIALLLTILYILYCFATKPLKMNTCLENKHSAEPENDSFDSTEKKSSEEKSQQKAIQHTKYTNSIVDYLKLIMIIAFVTYLFIGTGYLFYSCDRNSSVALLEKGEQCEEEGNYDKALEWYQKAAQKGDVIAYNHIGVLYKEGHGVLLNNIEAIKWFRRAADKDYAGGQYNLGIMYEEGLGVIQDDVEAEKWYRKAAEQGLAEAQFALACFYQEGRSVPKSDTEAVGWLRKSASQRYAKALCNLGLMYENGRGVSQNYKEAIRYYRDASELGNDAALLFLGLMYEHGKGVTQSDIEAVRLFRMAAERGNSCAQWCLGLMYEEGRGVDQDYRETLKWFSKAAEKGYANAQNQLGIMYATGQVVNQNDSVAAEWFRKAAEQGLAEAQYNLGSIYDNSKNMKNVNPEVLKWYHKAADQGNENAIKRLKEMTGE